MEITEAIRTRRSIRRYRPDPVPRKVLEEILDTCRWSGSAMNTQPWEFAILGGKVMKEFKDRLTKNAEAKAPEELPFPGIPEGGLPEIYDQRSAEYRTTSNNYHFPPGTENVEEKRRAHFAIGTRVHEAPNAIIVYTEKATLNWPWGFVSIGMITKTICLEALAHGLGTCVVGRPVAFPRILRELCQIPETKIFVVGIAIGYPDTEARINNFPRTRIPLESCAHWYGF
jgi:nitroreductase